MSARHSSRQVRHSSHIARSVKRGGKGPDWRKSKGMALLLVMLIGGLWVYIIATHVFGCSQPSGLVLPQAYICDACKALNVFNGDQGYIASCQKCGKKECYHAYACYNPKCKVDGQPFLFPYIVKEMASPPAGPDGAPSPGGMPGGMPFVDPIANPIKCPKCGTMLDPMFMGGGMPPGMGAPPGMPGAPGFTIEQYMTPEAKKMQAEYMEKMMRQAQAEGNK